MNRLKKVFNSVDVRIVALAVLYYVSAQLGLWLSFPISKSAPLWPPPGIAFALILLLGRRTWPAITIGSLIAHTLVFLELKIEFTMDTVAALVMVASGNTLEALFGFVLIHWFIKQKNPFLKTSHVFIYLGVALTMCFLGAGIGTLAFITNDLIQYQDALSKFFFWWTSNVVSVLTITPFIVSWTSPFTVKLTKQKIIESFAYIASLSIVLLGLFFEPAAYTVEKALPFLIMPFLLWLGFKFNLQTTATGILLVAFGAIYYTIQDQGPFFLESEDSSLLILQIFIGLISITTIILYATVHERTIAQYAMRRFSETLELKVKERTKELNEEIQTRKLAEERIKLSNMELRKANIELDNFVYSVSHDLRAPIASVLGIVNLAKQEKEINNIYQYLDMIAESADQQDSFIKDILNLSRNARLEVAREDIEFDAMISEIFDQLKFLRGNDNKVTKEIDIDQKLPFQSDKRRLKVVFNNLISNAIRYCNGSDPHIKIGVTVNDAMAKISIRDNGRGIAEEHLEHVFNMFYRATDDNAGSGLGLYIVKETIDKMRGAVDLKSKEHEGTEVTIEIPNLQDQVLT